MKQKSIDIFVAIGITFIGVLLAFIVTPNIIALRLLTLPLIFLLPGYALTSALFPGRDFGFVERILFSLGLSLLIVILGGLILNSTPFGLRTSSWAIFLGVITLGACAVALARRSRKPINPGVGATEDLSEETRATGKGSVFGGRGGILGGRPQEYAPTTFRQGLLLGLAALIVCGAVVMSIIGAEQQSFPGFTQLWILPASGANAKNSVLVGVKNMEKTTMQYRLTVQENGKVVKQWSAIDLQQGQNWQMTLVIPQAQQSSRIMVEALLYRSGISSTAYHHVVLWLGT